MRNSIRKLSLEKLIDSVKDQNNVDSAGLGECTGSIKSKVETREILSDDQEQIQGFISLSIELDVLETISLVHKSL